MFALYFTIVVNLAVAVTDSVILAKTRDILSDDYPGLWYLVVANMAVRYAFFVLTFVFDWDEADSSDRLTKIIIHQNCLFRIGFVLQMTVSLVTLCTMFGIASYKDVNSYYQTNYVSIYGTLVFECIWFFIILLGYSIYVCKTTECKCCWRLAEKFEKQPVESLDTKEEIKKLKILVQELTEKTGSLNLYQQGMYPPSAPYINN